MIQVESKETYMIYFPDELANFQLTGRELFEAVTYQRANINDIYTALERAVESGDSLQIGIVIGQILNKLKDANQTRPS
jgi:hypothetical protein